MQDFVDSEKNLCPEKKDVFRFLNNDLNNIKCVILGMDPYPSTYTYKGIEHPVATGRAFEVKNVDLWTDKYKQKSLLMIFKSLCFMKFGKEFSVSDLRTSVSKENFRYINIHDWFDSMEKSGVVFLNATLTTSIGKSNAHKNIWKDFMNELIEYINTFDCMWLIWGQDAYSRVKDLVDDKKIIYTCHPATRVNNTFVKDCVFSKIKSIKWV